MNLNEYECPSETPQNSDHDLDSNHRVLHSDSNNLNLSAININHLLIVKPESPKLEHHLMESVYWAFELSAFGQKAFQE